LIPPQFRTWGAVPASHFIDDMMRYLGHDYYVGYLSAAEAHDAAHQRPQVFQVVTNARLRPRSFGRVQVDFILSSRTTAKQFQNIRTPTGSMRVSTPEVTVLDLVTAPNHGGGLSNVATVIGDLLEDDKLDVDRLLRASSAYTAPVLQRAGWLIQLAANETGKQIDLRSLRGVIRNNSAATLLLSGNPPDGLLDKTWDVIVNAEIELDR
jgi:predicted transcriptional regulator of viral defense system